MGVFCVGSGVLMLMVRNGNQNLLIGGVLVILLGVLILTLGKVK
jgi:hypothetical protein